MVEESRSHFLCTSYVREQPRGPLYITSFANGALRVVAVLFNTEHVRSQLAQGAAIEDVVVSLKAFQHTDSKIPIEHLRKVVWNDFSADLTITHMDGRSSKQTKTYISSAEDKEQLLSSIRKSAATSVRSFDELASVMAVAWSRILGAVLALVGTVVFFMLWDPVQIGQLRVGALALLLGRTGCALVGLGIFSACCISAWLAIRKQSRYYTYEFGANLAQ